MSITLLTHTVVIFNLLVLSLILMSRKTKPHAILALLVLVPVPFFITHLVFAIYGYTPFTVQGIFPSSAISPLFGPLLLFYVEKVIHPRTSLLKPKNLIYVLHCSVPFFFWIRYLSLSTQEQLQYCDAVIAATDFEFIVFDILFIGHLFIFVPICYKRINDYKQLLGEHFSYETKTQVEWMRQLILITFWLNAGSLAILAPIWLFWSSILLVSMNIVLTLNVCTFYGFIIYQAVKHSTATDHKSRILSSTHEEEDYVTVLEELRDSKESVQISPAQIDLVADLFQKEQIYLEPNLRVKDVADKTALPVYLVSYIFNIGFGKSFFDYVNEQRVSHACQLFLEKKYEHFTIEGVGFESGFNSKTAFFRAFKKYKAMSPAEYKKQVPVMP